MAVFDKELWDYEYDEDTGTVRINAMGSLYGPTIEDYPEVFARVIDVLREVGGASSIVLASTRDYEYAGEQAEMLIEIAQLIQDITREGYLTRDADMQACQNYFPTWRSQLQQLIVEDLRSDPVGAYVKLKREIRHKKDEMEDAYNEAKKCYRFYIKHVLVPIKQRMEETRLIQQAEPHITGYHVGDREIYREFFHPLVRPNFMLTKYQALPPEQGQEVDRYTTQGGVTIQVFRTGGESGHIYHMTPPEFELSEDHYTLLDAARRYMASHRPETGEFAEPERMRDVFSNIGRDMIGELSDRMNIPVSGDDIESLTNILTRYTAGLGVLELVLGDTNVQDVYLNAPIGQSPMYLFHSDYEECKTNLVPTVEDAESWATRFRIQSGRPLDEANPVLDTELEVPGGRARVAIITRNLSPNGLAFAFRRHRDKPWTFPLFIDNKFFNGLAAGLLSFIIDGARSVLYAGTRSAGKTSLLGASIAELMKRKRIVSVEDTLELPIPAYKDLGYNAQRMKSRSVITQVEGEMPADEAIRTSLRLGDSVLLMGEVRSTEAKALYEAMRIGAVANYVAGTIHGESAYAVFDRVVNDLGVPRTSFKATDVIVIANRLKSADGLHTFRRITDIVEVRKEWEEDPLAEDAFVPLMEYNAETDQLEATETLENGESVILNEIAKDVPAWRYNWDAVWNNIQLRKRVKEELVKTAREHNDRSLLEAAFVVPANEQFNLITEQVNEELGEPDSEEVFSRWKTWLDQHVETQRNRG